jgi:alcohol dehydrogenase YqhD (iron-dependent ADH family)
MEKIATFLASDGTSLIAGTKFIADGVMTHISLMK